MPVIPPRKVSKKTSIDLDEDTLRLLAELQKGFGVSTNAAVYKKALKLAYYMVNAADKDHGVVVENARNHQKERLILNS